MTPAFPTLIGKDLTSDLWMEFRHCLRSMRCNPGFTGSAVTTLIFGIGASIAVFSIVNGVLLRPLPYPKPEELVVFVDKSESSNDWVLDGASPPIYRALREHNTAFRGMGMFAPGQSMDLTGRFEPERLDGCFITASAFGVLEARPAVGRLFSETEDVPGAGRVVVLSDGLWKRRFHNDKGVLGQGVVLNDHIYTVIGVMPPNFRFPTPRTEFWTPLNVEMGEVYNVPTARYGHNNLIARLKPGVTSKLAEANINTLLQQLKREFPTANEEPDKKLLPIRDFMVGRYGTILFLLMGAVGFVLLLACANVANLLLIRSEARRKEIGIRVALGASKARIIRQSMLESLLLCLAGGCGGLVVGYWTATLLVRIGPAKIPRLDEVSLDGRVLFAAIMAIIVCAVFVGLIPSVQAARTDVNETIKGKGARTATAPYAGRKAIIVCELALALVLLSGAVLMIRSVIYVLRLDLGFNPSNVLTFKLNRPLAKEDQGGFQAELARRTVFFQQLIDKICRLPEVQSVGGTSSLPLESTSLSRITTDASSKPPKERERWVDCYVVTTKYFEAMGIPILKGRAFNALDCADPVRSVIVDASMAQHFWPGEDPIGKRIKKGFSDSSDAWLDVIGIVPNVRKYGLGQEDLGWFAHTEQVYWPATQSLQMSLAVRTKMDPLRIAGSIREEVWKIDKSQPVSMMATMTSRVSEFTSEPRFYALVLTIFAAVGVALAAVGIYGVTSFWVAQRRHEIGVRMALGAQRSDVVSLVFRQGLVFVLAGSMTGLFGAFALTRFLSGIVYGLTATDPATFMGAIMLLGTVSLGAIFIPARRATRVDPIQVLRSE